MIHTAANGAVTLIDDVDPSRTKALAPGADLAAEALAFFGPEPLQKEVPMRLICKELLARGLKATVEATIQNLANAGIPLVSEAFAMAWEDWLRAPNLVTSDPVVTMVAFAANRTEAEAREIILSASRRS